MIGNEPHRIGDPMRELRAATARRHTREQVPFSPGKRTDLPDLIANLA